MDTKDRILSILVIITLSIIIMFSNVYGQVTSQPNSLIYISIEPPRSARVRFTTEENLVGKWPLGGFITENLYLTAFPQGRYLYLSVEPYGCYEILNIDVSPENIIVKKERDKVIAYLKVDYVNIRVALYEIPEDRCEYYQFGAFRFKKMDTLYAAIIATGFLVSVFIAYGFKGRREMKKEKEERYRREFKTRLDYFRMRFRLAGRTTMDPVCNLISMLLHPSYDLDKHSKEDLYKALADEEDLDVYLKMLCRDMERMDPLTAFMAHSDMWSHLALGLKTYLSALNLIPSTSKILEDFLTEGSYNYEIIRIDRAAIFEPLIKFVKEKQKLHKEALRKVGELLSEREDYAYRFYNPHPYYSTILKKVEEETGYRIGLNITPVKKEEETIKVGEKRLTREIKEAEKEDLRLEEKLHIEDLKFPEEARTIIEGIVEKKEKIYGEEKPVEEEKEVKVTVELPKYLMRQIEGLKTPINDLVESARRYLETGEGDGRALFREANKLVEKYGADMDEDSRISMLTMLTTIIPLIAREIESIREVEETDKRKKIGEVETEEVEHVIEEGAEIETIRRGFGRAGEEKPLAKGLEGLRISEVDYRYRIEVDRGQIYLIPYFKILPTFIVSDMIDTIKSQPIPIEGRKQRILEEIDTAIASGKTPVITLSKSGLPYRGMKNKEYYVKKLEEIIRILKEEELLHRVGFVMPEKIYLKYGGFGLKDGWDIFRLNLKTLDRLQKIMESLRKNEWIDEKIINILILPVMLSMKVREALSVPTKLLDEAMNEAKKSGDDEAEAVYWALKKIIQVKRRLIESEIPREYKKHVIALKHLRLVR